MDTLNVGVVGAGWMGHVHARAFGRLVQHWPDLPLRPRVVAVADAVRERMAELRPMLASSEAGPLVAVARFNQITRALVPALAGMAGMGRLRFAVANGVGALIWAALFTAIGYYFAEWWRSTSGLVHLIMALVVFASIGGWLLSRWRRKRNPVAEEPAPLREP